MKTFTIETREIYKCRYIIDAASLEEAMELFKDGGADEACEPEFYETLDINDPVEINDDEDTCD